MDSSLITRRHDTGLPDVRFGEAAKVWTQIGFTSFGGAAGQIAMMHKMLVEERQWIDEARFLHALNYCTLLPGPEAQQLATYIGWLLHGVRGGLYAGAMFVIPGALVMLGLSVTYVLGQDVPMIAAIFFGIKTAVLAIVAHALQRIAKRAFKGPLYVAIAIVAFLALLFANVPFPVLILTAALLGYVVQPRNQQPAAADDGALAAPAGQGGWAYVLRTAAIWISIWWAPVVLCAVLLGPHHILTSVGIFFGKMASLSFGGAYALLAWTAQEAVATHHWLNASEMADGLGLAETTPGPTILVTQHVGFLAGFRNPAPFTPLTSGILAALITSWLTFMPSYLWIFTGAPYVESLRANRRLSSALAAVTAVIVGVMAYLATWFALHLLFAEPQWLPWHGLRLPLIDPATLNVHALLLSAIAFVLTIGWHWNVVRVVLVMAVLGVLRQWALS
ncbi:chromate efflux transporter [Methylovirgula sp. 4M-Z18]|uniref:chromate efflux transporter n=1 Tax=Methylovirgula sp. 4M-Z18 TaxID=2293567 RepID=UPI000E2E98FF|nr:chromate efflux transporter [Methylovirgula sp. 4M-Z18]RFB81203.1 chromate efflux transporter [Methylovirgula sp. 4M-Z18]